MRALVVVVDAVLAQDRLQMALVQDQHAIPCLPPAGCWAAKVHRSCSPTVRVMTRESPSTFNSRVTIMPTFTGDKAADTDWSTVPVLIVQRVGAAVRVMAVDPGGLAPPPACP